MEKLELKHLAPYLPFNLEIKQPDAEGRNTFTLDVEGLRIMEVQGYGYFKPILRPLSDVKSYFEPIFETDKEVNEFLSYEELSPFSIDDIENYLLEYLPFGTCNLFFKHHFDVFDLIEKGLAIDIDTLSGEVS